MMSLSHCREHRLHCRVLLVVAVVLASTLPLVLAFTTTVPHPSYSSLLGQRRKNSISSSSYHPRQFTFTTAFLAKKNDDEDEDEEAAGGSQTGMDAAFRQLSALDSLFDNGDDKSQKKSKVQLDQDAKAALSDTERASIEEEAKLFRSMLEDSEQDEGVLYSDVLKDMGGTPKEGGTTVPSPKEKKEPSVIVQDIIRGNVLDGKLPEIPDSLEDKEKFMNQAIQEALEEARNMTPENRKSLSDSILDDEEIMKEIEEIFEKGNEKLLASLEEIRQEQKALAKTSAEQSAKVKMDQMNDEAQRLAAAEASMAKQLERVNKETKEVERAVEDLKRTQAEMDADPLLRLTSGKNPLKPAALAGTLLFSVRSVLDLIAMGGADSEAHLTAALIQGGIALVCAIYLLVF